MSNNFDALVAQAVATDDFTQVQTGGNFERELPEAGFGVCRLREYIEIGQQTTATKAYPNKKPARKARFVFEMTTPKHIREIEKEDKSIIKIPHVIAIEVAISKSEKSNYIKLFRKLNWKGDKTHPAQLLNEPYLCEIVLAGEKKGEITKDNPAKYANLQKDGVYTIAPPRKVDALAGTEEPINVPEMLNPVKLFLYDIPTKETWDSLFIDGTYTKEVNGTEQEISKNWLQEKILAALDFEGSALQAMLGGLDLGKSEQSEQAEQKTSASQSEESAKDSTAGTATEEPEPTTPAEKVQKTDPLANLGV